MNSQFIDYKQPHHDLRLTIYSLVIDGLENYDADDDHADHSDDDHINNTDYDDTDDDDDDDDDDKDD